MASTEYRISALIPFIVSCLFLCTTRAYSAEGIVSQAWQDSLFTSRVELTVSAPAPGHYTVDISSAALEQLFQKASPEPVTGDAFAQDSLVATTTDGTKIGEYKLWVDGKNIAAHGDFNPAVKVKASPWTKPGADFWTIRKRDDGKNIFWMEPRKVLGEHYDMVIPYQVVDLETGSLYYIRYDIYMDAQEGYGAETVGGPVRLSYMGEGKWHSELPSSYVEWMPPQRQWVSQALLQRATAPKAKLRMNTAIVGKIGFADVRVSKAEWRLIVDLPQAGNQTIYLYYVPRGGKQLTEPSPPRILNVDLPRITPVGEPVLKMQETGRQIFHAKLDNIEAWGIDPTTPLSLDKLAATKPTGTSSVPLKVTLAKGERRVILLALQVNTDDFILTRVDSSLTLPVKVQRVAAIPIYDNLSREKLLDTRLDAMVDVNDPLVPMHKNAPQVLAFTVHADESATPGHTSGNVQMEIQTAFPKRVKFDVPIDITVLPVTVKPMEHFQTNFGGHLLADNRGGEATSPAEYHGIEQYKPISGIDSMIQFDRIENYPLRDLADTYWRDVLEYCVQPISPVLYHPLLFKVTDTSADGSSPPKITDWNWAEYDRAVTEVIKERGVTCFSLLHTNGHGLGSIKMPEATYVCATSEAISDKYTSYDNPAYKVLKPEAFYQFVGDFFDSWAKHLDELGVLDRANICMDESVPSTFPAIARWCAELKSRPYARRIKIYFTLGQSSYYTQTVDGKQDSRLLLQDTFDFVAPCNDENYSLFTPNLWSEKRGPNPDKWVYYMNTEHLLLTSAGLNTLITPLKLEHYGVDGLHYWVLNYWGWAGGIACNPWLNANSGIGAGNMSFYYPPDPRGPAQEQTFKLIPSYRLALLREGIQDRALLEILKNGKDDVGRTLEIPAQDLERLRQQLDKLWINPVQWRLSRPLYYQWKRGLEEILMKS